MGRVRHERRDDGEGVATVARLFVFTYSQD